MTPVAEALRPATVAMVGNPNSGKTTLFNALTGLSHKIANYPGVTVEKKEGAMSFSGSRQTITVLDLPGTYSLLTRSPDEEVVHQVLSGKQLGTPPPDLLVVVVDASNLERNLFFATQVFEIGIPCVLVLNMWDLATQNGTKIQLDLLEATFGIRVIPTVGSRKEGLDQLKDAIEETLQNRGKKNLSHFKMRFPEKISPELSAIGSLIQKQLCFSESALHSEALRLLGDLEHRSFLFKEVSGLKDKVIASRSHLLQQGIDGASIEAETRYAFLQELCERAVCRAKDAPVSFSEKLDRVMTHKIWGFVIFAALMALMFQSIFSWAAIPMEWIDGLIGHFSQWIAPHLPEGQLKSLVLDGVIAGVGGVVIFLPQILFLFFFIALFEDTGYMARAAFVLDRLMRKVGLSGKSFIPLLSSFACAVPSIMATRTIEDKNDRLATILVAPLISCSARLPVYALMISAFIPSRPFAGFMNLQGLVLFSMYFLSIFSALAVAALFRKTLLKGSKTPFVLELPPYRIPNLHTVLMTMWEKAKQFLHRAGTIIFTLSILLWFLASYPRHPDTLAQYEASRVLAAQTLSGDALNQKLDLLHGNFQGEQIRNSYAGKLGHFIEPVIRPLGYDWKIGIGLIASFAAREVLVSTLAIVYNVGNAADDSNDKLAEKLRQERDPNTGRPVYSSLVAVSLMVFFVLACQCLSTVAVVKRETNSWFWPLFMISYMTVLAWCGSFLVFQIGLRLGF